MEFMDSETTFELRARFVKTEQRELISMSPVLMEEFW